MVCVVVRVISKLEFGVESVTFCLASITLASRSAGMTLPLENKDSNKSTPLKTSFPTGR